MTYAKWNDIKEMLVRQIPPEVIKEIPKGHRKFPYVTSGYLISVVNEIFGSHAWSEVGRPEISFTELELAYGLTIIVHCVRKFAFYGLDDNDKVVVKEISGVGSAVAWPTKENKKPSPDQIETAIKAAATDAFKRAVRFLGNGLGLQFYVDEDEILAVAMVNATFESIQENAITIEEMRDQLDDVDEIPFEDSKEKPQATRKSKANSRSASPATQGYTVKIGELSFAADAKVDRKIATALASKIVDRDKAKQNDENGTHYFHATRHLINHLRKHYGVESLTDLTYQELADLVDYVKGTRIPDRYKNKENESEAAEPEEVLPDNVDKALAEVNKLFKSFGHKYDGSAVPMDSSFLDLLSSEFLGEKFDNLSSEQKLHVLHQAIIMLIMVSNDDLDPNDKEAFMEFAKTLFESTKQTE